MNSNHKGLISESRFIIEACKQGCEISSPIGHAVPYDFIVRERFNKFSTVQVKTAHRKRSNGLRVDITREGCGYHKDDFDYLFASKDKDYWMIPWNAIKHCRSEVVVSARKYSKYKNNIPLKGVDRKNG